MRNGLINALIFAVVMTVTSCSSDNENASGEMAPEATAESDYAITENQFQSSQMKMGNLEMTEFHNIVSAKGMVDVPPQYRASVSTYFGGTVKDLELLTGELVKKGQTLFVLENPEYVQMQQDYLEAKGQLTYLKSDYERQKNLVQDNVTSQKNYLKAESDYTVTKVKVESLGKKLKMMNIDPNKLTMENMSSTISINSPVEGYVTAINVTRGVFLNPSQTAISIVNTSHLHLELNIFEKDLSKVRVGQKLKFKIQDDDDKEYDGSVHLVNKSVDPENRTIGIHGHLSDEKLTERFNPGMYVEADIYTASEAKPSLPNEALVDIDGQMYVLVVESSLDGNYVFEKKDVKTGLSNREFTEILNAEDFNEDTKFLVRGAFNMIKE